MPTGAGSWVCQKFGREYTDEFQRRHAIKTFHVFTGTIPLDDLDLVLNHTGIPILGEYYEPASPYLTCASREVRELGKDNYNFEVVCTYDMTPYFNWGVKITTQGVDTVLERTMAPTVGVGIPARFNIAPAKYLGSLPAGAADEFVLNRAKDPFDPPVMTERRQTVITLTNLVQDITDLGFTNIGELIANVGKVNSERIQIFSIPDETGMGADYWTLLMDDINVDKLQRPDGGCDLAVTMRIIYDPQAHCPVVLNAGYNELVNNKRRKCYDGGQVEVSAPVCLDKDGLKIDPASLPGAATYIVFPDHETVNFNIFNFPATFCGAMPTPAP